MFAWSAVNSRNIVSCFRRACLAGTMLAGLCAAQSVPFGPVTDGLYLLTATVKGSVRYGADLYRFDPSGKLMLAQNIVKGEGEGSDPLQLGAAFVIADYEGRALVIGSPSLSPTRLDVILMDTPGALLRKQFEPPDLASPQWIPWRSLPFPAARGSNDPRAKLPMLMKAWVTNYNGVRSIMMHWTSRTGYLYMAVPLTMAGLGAQKIVPESDKAYQQASGVFGLANLGDSNIIPVRVNRNRLVSADKVSSDLGLPAPAGASEANNSKHPHLLINNKQMAVLYEPPAPSEEQSSLQVWTPKSGKWTTVLAPGSYPEVRGIGNWILGAASMVPRGRVSPGKAERQKRSNIRGKGIKQRPNTDEWFDGIYYPGVLFAIDTTTGKMITWQTGQGDSEPLLVRDDSVIYRVNDRLYTARIQGANLGSPQLLAQDEAIPDMHWAFTSK